MTRFKKTILFIHRWLGFISGLVVFVVSVTGCLFVFQDDIQDALYSYRKVEVQHRPYLLPSQLKQKALKRYVESQASITAYYGPDRPAVVMINTPKLGIHYIYLNPYTGQFLKDENIDRNFFIVVEYIHLYLLLPPKIGSLVVGTSVVIFVILLISGMVLWWPKRKADRKRSFNIKWKGRWRRVNYDLHNVLGFYACSTALILGITGLAIAFEWMQKGIYSAVNLGKTYAVEKLKVRSNPAQKSFNVKQPCDKAFIYAKTHSPNAQMFFVMEGDKKTNAATTVTAYAKSLHYYHGDDYSFDQYSGRLVKALPHVKKSAGMKMNDANYDIHVGQLLGFPGKVIAFLTSLICASLPVTGFIVWLGKRKKKKRNSKIRHNQLAVGFAS